MNFDDIRLFAAVAEAGSYAKAAARLGVARSTLSRAVQRLEADSGVRLLHRTTRKVGLTPAGAAFFARAQPGLDELETALGLLEQEQAEPSGVLRVSASTDLAAAVLAPVLADLGARYPRLQIETVLTLRPVDLVAERVDVALRVYAAAPNDGTLAGRRLMTLAFGWYVAPAYAERRGIPQGEHELAVHDVISVARTGHWGRYRVDDSFVALALVRAGAGLALLPRQLCEPEVRAGTLLRVLPEVSVMEGQTWLVYPLGGLTTNVAAFRDAVVAWADTHAE